MTEAAAPPKRSTWEALAVFFERRSLVMLTLGFAAGLPNLLLYDTLSAWMRQAKLPLDVITLFSLVTITYAIKFLWAPIVDRVKIPVLHQVLGHLLQARFGAEMETARNKPARQTDLRC